MQAVLRNEFFTLTVDTLGAEAVSLKNAAGAIYYDQLEPEDDPQIQAALELLEKK